MSFTQKTSRCFFFSFKKGNGNSQGLIRLSNNLYRRRCTKTKQIMRPYYVSLIISFFLYFSYKFVLSSFEIHSVLVTGTVATCCVYLKNLIAQRRWKIFEVLTFQNSWEKFYNEPLNDNLFCCFAVGLVFLGPFLCVFIVYIFLITLVIFSRAPHYPGCQRFFSLTATERKNLWYRPHFYAPSDWHWKNE